MKNTIIITTLLLLVLAACTPSLPTQVHIIEKLVPMDDGTYEEYALNPDLDPITFESEQAYQAFTKQHQGRSYSFYGRGFGGPAILEFAEEAVAFDSAAPVAAKSVAQDGGIDFSGTNNQVATVDEADIIKTNGEYIYTITDGTLFVISAGEDAKVLSSVDVEGSAFGLFIQDDKLIVFGRNSEYDFYDRLSFAPYNAFTYAKQYDISDASNLELIDEIVVEGNYYTARMHDEKVYLVLRSTPQYRAVHPLPIIFDGEVKEMAVSDISYFPYPYRSPELVTVHEFAIDEFAVVDSTAVSVDNLQSVYMSQEHIYLVGREYISEWDIEQELIRELLEDELSSFDKTLIGEIKQVSDSILSRGEKEQKIQQVYNNYINSLSVKEQDAFYDDVEDKLEDKLASYDYFEYSSLTKIPTKSLDVQATAKVPGMIVNQFALDEHDDYLRIATTIPQRWSRYGGERTESSSQVHILDEDLDLTGSIKNIAPTERIFSTRFVDDRLYMVTFRQVDPFFVVDLSNPKKPSILGELKIPGFSRYLHPYDENHIIGIGQDASETGRTTGLKISLFDVTNVEKPIEVASYVGDDRYAGSSALYEHKAFLFSKEKNLLVMPVYNYDYRDEGESYSGAFVFSIDEEEIQLRGLVDHGASNNWYYGSQVERSLYIEDLLYTKSPQLLRVNDLEDLSSVQNVTLKVKTNKFPVY